jgi:hypothetical protein
MSNKLPLFTRSGDAREEAPEARRGHSEAIHRFVELGLKAKGR